ncbi:MAG: hypothetical protein V1718_05075, partial [archaeon]
MNRLLPNNSYNIQTRDKNINTAKNEVKKISIIYILAHDKRGKRGIFMANEVLLNDKDGDLDI